MKNRKKNILSLFKRKLKEKEAFFLQNGSTLLQDRFSSSIAESSPIRSYSIQDLINATNNFDKHQLIYSGLWCRMYKGSYGNRPVLVKMIAENSAISSQSQALLPIHDIAVTSQLSNHKNILKLLGCCLELQVPSLVYEYEGCELLRYLISTESGHRLPWKSRLRIAKDIAYAVVYLHTAFSAPIIHANLSPKKVIVDQHGVAKLFDFSLSISLHPEESHLQDVGVGCMVVSIDPEYQKTGIASTKFDVYSFGVILLVLLTGEQFIGGSAGNIFCITDQGKKYVEEDHLNQIIDTRILGEGGGAQKQQNLQDFWKLALRCVQGKCENRPEMIEVAKELKRIEMVFHS
ncbi:hypothetical protein ACH5RR_002119 [Cinchona calisaya]|uniref:Protein kinase domain-containing protein n=1 Tax=Cinchona calisaya TaxID=153742 RepID=A0ABD3B5Z9_9GENT